DWSRPIRTVKTVDYILSPLIIGAWHKFEYRTLIRRTSTCCRSEEVAVTVKKQATRGTASIGSPLKGVKDAEGIRVVRGRTRFEDVAAKPANPRDAGIGDSVETPCAVQDQGSYRTTAIRRALEPVQDAVNPPATRFPG